MEIFIFWFFFAIVVGVAASARGRSGFGWFILAVFISPLLAVILLALFPSLKKEAVIVTSNGAVPTPETHVKCPECRELVFKDAKKCRFCGITLIPQ